MKLTVIVLTFNQESFVRQTLESIICQKTNFEIEIIVSDDGSTDKTIEIIEEIKRKSKIKIIPIYNDKNKGVLKNALGVFSSISGQYLAVVDGDDFWNFDGKLQQQVDFLDTNIDYAGCFHDTKIISDSNASSSLFYGASNYSDIYKYRQDVYPADIIKRLILPTSSLVLRTSFLNSFDFSVLKDNYSIVWKLTCFAIFKSKFYYFNKVWSTYRNHLKGISKSNNINFHQSHILFLESLSKNKNFENNLLDIFNALSSEYQIVIERKLNKDWKLKKVFYDYTKSEFKRIFYFYKFIFIK
jgi:glycosyltransferase involved in cell wall biosynthesis